MLLGIISQCGPPSCALQRKVFLSPLVWEKREYIQKLNWKRSLLICFENYPGVSCYRLQNRNRMKNTFIIVNITPILAQTIYTLLKNSSSKWKFLKLSSAQVKICQIPHVNLETASQFFFKFYIILHCHDTNLCKF